MSTSPQDNQGTAWEAMRGFLRAIFGQNIKGYYLDLQKCIYYSIGQEGAGSGLYVTSYPWQVFGEYIQTRVHPADRELVTCMTRIDYIRERLSREQSYSIELREREYGIEHWYRMVVMRGLDPDHAAFSFENISEEHVMRQREANSLVEMKRLNKELEESQTRMEEAVAELKEANLTIRRIHEVLGSCIWQVWFDSEGAVSRIEWSNEMRRMLGFTDEHDFPNTLEALNNQIHPDDLPHVLEQTQGAVSSQLTKEGESYSNQLRIRHKSGEYHWYRVRIIGVSHNTGKLFYGVMMDFTDSDRMQRKLQESIREISTLHDVLGTANWRITYDREGMRTSINWGKHLRQMLDYTYEEFPDTLEVLDLVHPEDRGILVSNYWDTVNDYTNQKTLHVYFRLRTHTKGYRWYLTTARMIRHIDGKPDIFYGVAMDVDDQVNASRRLEEARREAEAANAAKTSFLFNMSHDIRTPMNAIMGFRDLLEKHQDDPVKRADYLHKIDESSQVLLSIINNVLEMARIEKGNITLEETAWSTEQFINSICSIFLDMMKQKNLTFRHKVNVQHHCVYCDPIKLREVFINIVSNAYKYTPEGGEIDLLVEEVPCEREGYTRYRTSIKDTGIGMSAEFLPHIFEEFSRENTSTDNKIEGTGLGLPIVKRLVDMMGGQIEVQSQKGAGSTFTITLDHRLAEQMQLAEHEGVTIDPNLFTGKHILLAEDNDLNAEIAEEILQEAGFIIDRAEDGQICCDMLAKAPAHYYDVILMDIQMPNMNGYDATRTIRTMEDVDKANIPILAMTANAFEEDKHAAFRAGMNGHLSKPIDVHELFKELSRTLG